MASILSQPQCVKIVPVKDSRKRWIFIFLCEVNIQNANNAWTLAFSWTDGWMLWRNLAYVHTNTGYRERSVNEA